MLKPAWHPEKHMGLFLVADKPKIVGCLLGELHEGNDPLHTTQQILSTKMNFAFYLGCRFPPCFEYSVIWYMPPFTYMRDEEPGRQALWPGSFCMPGTLMTWYLIH